MTDQKTLENILESQKRQEELLSKLLEGTERRDNKYFEYLEGQAKSNEEYRIELERTADENAKSEEIRMKEHESYMRGNKLSRVTNYIRLLANICIAALVGYIVLFGVSIR